MDAPPCTLIDGNSNAHLKKELTLNADPAAQLRLLDVQGLDSRLDQLAHRRTHLPEHADVSRLTAELTEVGDLVVGAETEESDVAREVQKAEADVEAIRVRARRDQQRMDSGAVGSAKELEALGHELGSLAKRQADLEEIELDAMERLESIQQHLAGLEIRRTALETELESVTGSRDSQLAEIDRDAAYITGERERAAHGLPDELMALYAKLRVAQGGVGAAPLHARKCQGCHLQLTPIDIARIRDAAPDEVLRCDECRRILVRTPDSGL